MPYGGFDVYIARVDIYLLVGNKLLLDQEAPYGMDPLLIGVPASWVSVDGENNPCVGVRRPCLSSKKLFPRHLQCPWKNVR
jgi:hypothetical protein